MHVYLIPLSIVSGKPFCDRGGKICFYSRSFFIDWKRKSQMKRSLWIRCKKRKIPGKFSVNSFCCMTISDLILRIHPANSSQYDAMECVLGTPIYSLDCPL